VYPTSKSGSLIEFHESQRIPTPLVPQSFSLGTYTGSLLMYMCGRYGIPAGGSRTIRSTTTWHDLDVDASYAKKAKLCESVFRGRTRGDRTRVRVIRNASRSIEPIANEPKIRNKIWRGPSNQKTHVFGYFRYIALKCSFELAFRSRQSFFMLHRIVLPSSVGI
jgi:hypothetical protein